MQTCQKGICMLRGAVFGAKKSLNGNPAFTGTRGFFFCLLPVGTILRAIYPI